MSVCFRLGMLFEYGHSNLLADGQTNEDLPRSEE